MDRVLGIEGIELIGINNRNLGKATLAFTKNGLLYETCLLFKYMIVCYFASNLCLLLIYLFFSSKFYGVKTSSSSFLLL